MTVGRVAQRPRGLAAAHRAAARPSSRKTSSPAGSRAASTPSIAPVFACLDAIEAYVDPLISPEDFLPWLASWVGIVLDENWPVEQQRAFIRNAVELFRMRGTVRGIKAEIELLTGGGVELSETGDVAYSSVPNGPLPGEDYPRLSIRVTLPAGSPVTDRSIDLVIKAAKPAHVVSAVEIVRG